MSNLVPEPRPDKNGKIVIRHVKFDVGGHDIAVPIPAPVAPPVPVESMEEAMRYDLASAMLQKTVNYDDWKFDEEDDFASDQGLRHDSFMATLQSYPDDFIRFLDGVQSDHPAVNFEIVARMVEQGEEKEFVSNYIDFGDIGGDDNPDYGIALARSLNHYPQVQQHGYLRNAVPEVKASVRALLTVASTINDISFEENVPDEVLGADDHPYDAQATPILMDPKLVDFVLDNAPRADAIVAAITQRKVYDPDVIRVVIDHPERALADGAL